MAVESGIADDNIAWQRCRFLPHGKGRLRVTPSLIIADIPVEIYRTILIFDIKSIGASSRKVSEIGWWIGAFGLGFLLISLLDFAMAGRGMISVAYLIWLLGFALSLPPLWFLSRKTVTKIGAFPSNADRPVHFEVAGMPLRKLNDIPKFSRTTVVRQSPLNLEWTVYDPLKHNLNRGAEWSFVLGLFLLLAVLISPLSPFLLFLTPVPILVFALSGFRAKRRAHRTLDPRHISAFRHICAGRDQDALTLLTELLRENKDVNLAMISVILYMIELQLHRAAETCEGYPELAELQAELRRISSI